MKDQETGFSYDCDQSVMIRNINQRFTSPKKDYRHENTELVWCTGCIIMLGIWIR